jgi:hypothetical protein
VLDLDLEAGGCGCVVYKIIQPASCTACECETATHRSPVCWQVPKIKRKKRKKLPLKVRLSSMLCICCVFFLRMGVGVGGVVSCFLFLVYETIVIHNSQFSIHHNHPSSRCIHFAELCVYLALCHCTVPSIADAGRSHQPAGFHQDAA